MTSTTGVPPQHRNAVLVGRMRAAFDGMSGMGSWSMSTDELGDYLADLQGLMAQTQAEFLAAVREADRREVAKTSGAANTAAWLSGRLRMRPEEAGRAVKLARDLDSHLPSTREALTAGELSADHADVIARSVRKLPAEAGPEKRAEAEQLLVKEARTFDPKDLAGLGREILRRVDPDHADRILAKQFAAEEARAEREREIILWDDPYSISTFLRGKLDPITNEMFRVALEPLSKPRPTDANGPDLRTPAQRMGDGFHELLRRFLASGATPTHAGEKPQIVLTIDPDKLRDGTGTGELLHTGASISARTVQELACDAHISTYTPGGAGSEPGNGTGGESLSDGVRLYTGKVRRMLELRDRGCAFPGCNRPPSWCQAHHIVPWSKGGLTTVANGVLLCGYHHRHLHQDTWQVRTARDGHPRVHPTRVDRQAPKPTPQPPHPKLKTQSPERHRDGHTRGHVDPPSRRHPRTAAVRSHDAPTTLRPPATLAHPHCRAAVAGYEWRTDAAPGAGDKWRTDAAQ